MTKRLQWVCVKLSVVVCFILLSVIIASVAWFFFPLVFPDYPAFALSFWKYFILAAVVLGLSLIPHLFSRDRWECACKRQRH